MRTTAIQSAAEKPAADALLRSFMPHFASADHTALSRIQCGEEMTSPYQQRPAISETKIAKSHGRRTYLPLKLRAATQSSAGPNTVSPAQRNKCPSFDQYREISP